MGPQEPTKPKQQSEPATPAAASAAATPGGTASPEKAPKKKLSRGALLGIIFGSVGVVLLAVGIVLAVVFLGAPSKAEYEKAFERGKEIAREYNDIDTRDKLKGVESAEDVDKVVDEIKSQFDKNNDELAGMKAMNDSEVKEAFNKYKDAYDAALPQMRNQLKAQMQYKKVSKVCTSNKLRVEGNIKDRAEAEKKFDENAKECTDTLKSMQELDEDSAKEYASGYTKYVEALRKFYGDDAEARGQGGAYHAMNNLRVPYQFDYVKSRGVGLPTALKDEKYDYAKAFNNYLKTLQRKARD